MAVLGPQTLSRARAFSLWRYTHESVVRRPDMNERPQSHFDSSRSFDALFRNGEANRSAGPETSGGDGFLARSRWGVRPRSTKWPLLYWRERQTPAPFPKAHRGAGESGMKPPFPSPPMDGPPGFIMARHSLRPFGGVTACPNPKQIHTARVVDMLSPPGPGLREDPINRQDQGSFSPSGHPFSSNDSETILSDRTRIRCPLSSFRTAAHSAFRFFLAPARLPVEKRGPPYSGLDRHGNPDAARVPTYSQAAPPSHRRQLSGCSRATGARIDRFQTANLSTWSFNIPYLCRRPILFQGGKEIALPSASR